MRNIIRTALVLGTLATPMISMADTAKKDAPKADAKAPEAKEAPKADAPKTEAKDAPKADHKDAKKDAKAPATK